jgi:hypothetical protein
VSVGSDRPKTLFWRRRSEKGRGKKEEVEI